MTVAVVREQAEPRGWWRVDCFAFVRELSVTAIYDRVEVCIDSNPRRWRWFACWLIAEVKNHKGYNVTVMSLQARRKNSLLWTLVQDMIGGVDVEEILDRLQEEHQPHRDLFGLRAVLDGKKTKADPCTKCHGYGSLLSPWQFGPCPWCYRTGRRDVEDAMRRGDSDMWWLDEVAS